MRRMSALAENVQVWREGRVCDLDLFLLAQLWQYRRTKVQSCGMISLASFKCAALSAYICCELQDYDMQWDQQIKSTIRESMRYFGDHMPDPVNIGASSHCLLYKCGNHHVRGQASDWREQNKQDALFVHNMCAKFVCCANATEWPHNIVHCATSWLHGLGQGAAGKGGNGE